MSLERGEIPYQIETLYLTGTALTISKCVGWEHLERRLACWVFAEMLLKRVLLFLCSGSLFRDHLLMIHLFSPFTWLFNTGVRRHQASCMCSFFHSELANLPPSVLASVS